MSAKMQHQQVTALKYTKIHSPKMKSVYWKYFGFPTNDDEIITKQNVVCILCHKMLKNHGNTTNLRAHLQHRHKEVFSRVCAEFGINVPARKIKQEPKDDTEQSPKTTRLKFEKRERRDTIKLAMDNLSDVHGEGTTYAIEQDTEQEHDMLYETMVPITYDDDEMMDGDHFAKVEIADSNSGGGSSQATHLLHASSAAGISAAQATIKRSNSNYRIDVLEEIDPYQLQDMLVKMIIKDVINVENVYEQGLAKLICDLGNTNSMPQQLKLESLIKEQHSDKFTTFSDAIKVHSQLKHYSLGFELWHNVENKRFTSIYFNYTTDQPNCRLLNQLYYTIEYNKYTPIDSIFEEFNLANCTAALLNYNEDDFVMEFLKSKNIPIILSFDISINKCLRAVYELPAVADIIEKIKDVIMRYSSAIVSEVDIPNTHDYFPWSNYYLLKFFAESVAWPEHVDMLVNHAKIISDILNILLITLDTLKSEDIPQSSMLSPITANILGKKLCSNDGDDELVVEIKAVISSELNKYVVSDDHLTTAALLDPRFHRLTGVNNIKSCLKILSEKYNDLCVSEGFCMPETMAEPNTHNTSSSSTANKTNKSSLELFFDLQDSAPPPIKNKKENNVEGDLKRYRQDVYVGLDEAPLLWWHKAGNMYPTLRRLAPLYHCVPCVVNLNFKKSLKEQIRDHTKRHMLTGSLIDAILFLHHNQNKC